METIEERARQWASEERPYGGQTELIRGYIAGATEQKQIDEDAMHAIVEEQVIKAVERQRQIDIDKACRNVELLLTAIKTYDNKEALISEFRRAMEK